MEIDPSSVWQSNQLALGLIFLLFVGLALLILLVGLYYVVRFLRHYFSSQQRRQRRIESEAKRKRRPKRKPKVQTMEFKLSEPSLMKVREKQRQQQAEREKLAGSSDRPDWLR